MIDLPKEFRHRISATWGAEGREWLEHLPGLILHCQKQWSLSINPTLPALSYNFVAFAIRRDGSQVVLKIGVPRPELAAEIEALRLYGGKQAVELLEVDIQSSAFLLQRLTPGQTLSQLNDDEAATTIAAQLMRDLPVSTPPDGIFPALDQWALAFTRLRQRFNGQTGPLPAGLVEKAEQLFKELQASAPPPMLLHGDLHHENILSHGKGSWLAIDPQGVIGDPAYESARFQHNPMPRFLSMEQPRRVVEQRVEILAGILRQDRARLLAWAFFDCILSACWSVEDNDDWHYSIACAQIFDPLTH